MDQLSHRRAWPLRALAIFALISSPILVRAQISGFELNPVDNFCGRWYQQSIVKNDILYIDSGVQKWNGTDVSEPIYGINNYILTIPLDFTWDWKTNIIIDAIPKNETNPSTGTLPPSLTRGHMFHGPADDPAVYIYGGTTFMGNRSFAGHIRPDSSTYPLWAYTANSSDYPWSQYDVGLPWMPNHGAAAEAIDQNLGFYLNGQIDWGTSVQTVNFSNTSTYRPLEGMIVLDLQNHTSRNISTPGLGGDGPRVGGTMEYIADVGGSGILIALGGMVNNEYRTVSYSDANRGDLIEFSAVDVFDINSYLQNPTGNGTWYRQNTTGDIPPARIDFCTTSISAPDNSSHHIYLYGGIDRNLGSENDIRAGYDDVYVLSIPSFTWTPIFQNGASPRWGHNCHVAGKRQMVTVGGNITNTGVCDWELKGVAFLDMSTVTWGSVFLSNQTDYTVPTKVLPATGGTISGAATIKEPEEGWTDPGLKTVFDTPRKWGSESSPTATPAATGGKSNIGAIAGGVVGGVVGLAVLAGLLFFWKRRHDKEKGPHELSNEEVQPPELGLDNYKKRYEMQGVNENDPAELPGPEAQELNAPRIFVEADRTTATNRAELSATNIVPGGVHGVPIVRTPGDDLPTPPLSAPISPPIADVTNQPSDLRASNT
ncbi:hypothetical protein CC78DRAFT_582331 [Lojkania enalia]|uniref:Cell wall anchored protein n=1 Tax=Lojkania enalia TaxID=147567 RepID=A0A9P4K826_9PLEO|nr:hypothetical protein CC78DRAFT_582331 [Didymosphaeria enalia]